MTTLIDWIGPFFERSFEQLLDQNTSSPDVEIESDVSNLYVRQNIRQRVQVIQLAHSTARLKGKVCDKSTIIETEFQQDFDRHYERGHADISSRLGPGSIIEICSIELRITDVFNPYRTTLWVTDFDIVHREQRFPPNLVELDTLRQVQDLLTTYFDFSTGPSVLSEMRSPEIQSQAGSPVQCSYDSDAENHDSMDISQVQFATQANTTFRNKSPSPIARKRVNTTQDLHALLQPAFKRQRTSETQPDSTKYDYDMVQPKSKQITRDNAKEPSLRSTENTRDISSLWDHSRGNRRTDQTAAAANGDRSHVQQSHMETYKKAERLAGQTLVADSTKSNMRPTAIGSFAALPHHLVKGRYLSRRLFRIPPDQKKLFDGNTCWQPPKIGQPAPHGCIPPNLLERLVQASKFSIKEEERNASHTHSLSEADGDSDENATDKTSQPTTVKKVQAQPKKSHEPGVSAFTFDDLEDEDESESDKEVDSDRWPQSSPVSSRLVNAVSVGPASGAVETRIISSGECMRTSQTPVPRGGGSTQMEQTRLGEELACDEPATKIKVQVGASSGLPEMQSSQLSRSQVSTRSHPDAEISAKGTVTSPGTQAPEKAVNPSPDTSGVQIHRTPLTQPKQQDHNINLRKDQHSSDAIPEDASQGHGLFTQISATFNRSPGLPPLTHGPVGELPGVTNSGSSAMSIMPNLLDEENDAYEAWQQLYSEINKHSELSEGPSGDEPDAEKPAGTLRPNTLQQNQGLAEPPPEDSTARLVATRHAREPLMLGRQAAGPNESGVIVPTSSSPVCNVKAIMTEKGQAARREFFAKQTETASSETNMVSSENSAQQSSKTNSRKASSDVQAAQDRTPNTSVFPDPKFECQNFAPKTDLEHLFAAFCNAYPSYNGKIMHFRRVCHLIRSLRKDGRAPHAFLWDDFVYRHRREFLNYQLEQAEAGLDSMPYIEYYNEHIEMPEFSKGIVKADFVKSLSDESIQPAAASSPSNTDLKSQPGSRQDSPPRQKLSRYSTDETGPGRTTLDRFIAASSSASNVALLHHLQGKSSLPSSPPPLPISQGGVDLPKTQSSLVESWLNTASGHQSPVLGVSDNGHESHDANMLDTDVEIAESVTSDVSHHSPPSPVPPQLRNNTLSSVRELRGGEGAKKSKANVKSRPWWHDRNTAFKEWARSHEQVARRKRREPAALVTDEDGVIEPVLKNNIDVRTWRMNIMGNAS